MACAAGALTVVLVVVGLRVACADDLRETVQLIAKAVNRGPRLRRRAASA